MPKRTIYDSIEFLEFFCSNDTANGAKRTNFVSLKIFIQKSTPWCGCTMRLNPNNEKNPCCMHKIASHSSHSHVREAFVEPLIGVCGNYTFNSMIYGWSENIHFNRFFFSLVVLDICDGMSQKCICTRARKRVVKRCWCQNTPHLPHIGRSIWPSRSRSIKV